MPRYYTFKRKVPLKKGQVASFRKGSGWFAKAVPVKVVKPAAKKKPVAVPQGEAKNQAPFVQKSAPKPAAKKPAVSMHAAALKWALAQVGKTEIPSGSNTGPFVILCQRATWLGGTGWAWCRAFTLRARMEGGDKPEDGSAGAWDALSRAQSRGQALTAAQWHLAVPGDEVILSEGAGHACMLRGVQTVAGRIVCETVDGNWGDKVTLTSHDLGIVKGFIHWPEQGVKTPVRPPRSQVVGGADGKRKLVTRGGKTLPLPKKRPAGSL